MTIFSAIGIAGTGVTVYRKWLDAVSDNIANINNADPTDGERLPGPLRRRPATATGRQRRRQVAGIALGSAEGRLVYEPDNPLADAEGYVRYPDIDLGRQMAQLIMAQRGYQANLAVVDRARDAYQAALQLGRNCMTVPIGADQRPSLPDSCRRSRRPTPSDAAATAGSGADFAEHARAGPAELQDLAGQGRRPRRAGRHRHT